MCFSKLKNFYKDKKVLVTGHTGFVGAWLCMVLDCLGAEIIGFSLKEEKNSLYEKIKNDLSIKNYYGDLRNREEIRECIDKNQPDILFHLAAFGFVHECENDPYMAFSSNIMGTVNLLDAVRESTSINDIVIASSDKVYRNDDMAVLLFKEKDSLGGIDPYSCSKTCEDLIAQSYFETYLKDQGKSVTILRPSNIVGGGDHNESRLIPSIISGIENNKKIAIRNPEAVRPWQYILDAVDAYVLMAVKAWNARAVQIYNIGPTPENIRSVGEIVKILSMSAAEAENIYCPDSHSQSLLEKRYLGLDIEKIKVETGWLPRKKIEETMHDTYNFYKERDYQNSYDLCRKYIKTYYQI